MSHPRLAVLEVYCSTCGRRYPETEVDQDTGACRNCRGLETETEALPPAGFAADTTFTVNVVAEEEWTVTRADWDGTEEEWVEAITALRAHRNGAPWETFAKVYSRLKWKYEHEADLDPEVTLWLTEPKPKVAVINPQGDLL